MQPNYLPKVREQYEALPYPPCNPEDEHRRLRITQLDRLDYLNHRFFDGAETFGSGFRALSAGDGTGDASIFLAEQLAATGGHVVALDLSSASQAIAKERAALRKLTNLTHIHASLLDIGTLGLGTFDVISCSGVLHHLADPAAGLRALASALKPTGVMGIMVYSTLDRTAIYHLQAALRLLFKHQPDVERQIALTREIIGQLPATNWVHHDFRWPTSDWSKGDAGLFDLLLHTQDRAYTIPQLYEWAAEAGLHLAELTTPYSHQEVMYNPLTYIADDAFAARIEALPIPTRQAIAELLAGLIHQHFLYLTPTSPPAELSGEDLSLIPSLSTAMVVRPDERDTALATLRQSVGKKAIYITIACAGRIKLSPLTATADLLAAIDDTHTIGQIIEQVAAQHPALSHDAIAHQWRTLFAEARLCSLLVLRRAGGAFIPSASVLQTQRLNRP